MCYAGVINGSDRQILSSELMLDFLGCFLASSAEPAEVYFCGAGEVFLHPEFPRVVNHLTASWTAERLKVTIQTNGTVPRLPELARIERIDLHVSLDGAPRLNGGNRGEGNYERTIRFCAEAKQRGCRSLIVRTLLTQESLHGLDELNRELTERVGANVPIWLNLLYTNDFVAQWRRLTSCVSDRPFDDGKAISRSAALATLKDKYENRYELDETEDFVANYLSLTPEGVFSCCHRIHRLGSADADVAVLQNGLAFAAERCRQCPVFPCQ
jgi:MoaA/NifB/PqqE/SkfB family radical SAM enzyme